MRITSWNILHGMAIPPAAKGAKPTTLADAGQKIAAELTPDLIGVQECDYAVVRSQNPNQIPQIATSIGAPSFPFAPCTIGTPGETWRTLNTVAQTIISNPDSSSHKGSYGLVTPPTAQVIQSYTL